MRHWPAAPSAKMFLPALLLLALFGLLAPDAALAAASDAPKLDGKALSLIWALPFAGMLLSIAIFPLVAVDFWHSHFGKIAVFWALAFLTPCLIIFGWDVTLFITLEVALHEYMPFIILLFALFTIAGGVRITGRLKGTPLVNSAILLVGTVIASWMGTTGAAMLLIRPLLNANESRTHKVHTVVFFIFLVANIGGSLTPLGDPPLFLGFLRGVDFFWPTVHMFMPMLLVSVILLVLYYLIDRYIFFPRESLPKDTQETPQAIGLEGSVNLLLLAGVVAAVLMSGTWKPDFTLPNIFYVDMKLQNLVRDLLLVSLALLSLRLTVNESRTANGFTWFPIIEVAKLFLGIFITIAPMLAILRAGDAGALSALLGSISNEAGEPINAAYFWITGLLSAFLDNAPTYIVFFEAAGAPAEANGYENAAFYLKEALPGTLLAVSAGAVFMGALSYIGNAPNFMVRTIAEHSGVKMPSFFGYMLWSLAILVPILALVTLIWF